MTLVMHCQDVGSCEMLPKQVQIIMEPCLFIPECFVLTFILPSYN